MRMVINVTQEDIDKGGNPIENAVKREHGIGCRVEKKFIIFDGNETHPFRLSAQAEAVTYAAFAGNCDIEPFSFEVG